MILTDEEKRKLIRVGSIWRRKQNGNWENVYLESIKSSCLRDGTNYIDVRTEFGLEPIKRKEFLKSYEFLGFAKLKLSELASDKNLLPFKEDITNYERK